MSKKFGIRACNLLANLVISSLIGATAAHAAAPVQSEQAPGFYRQQVGDAVVTAVYDGYLDLDPKDLSGMTQQQIQVHIAKLFQAKNSTVQTAVNAYLVHTKDNLGQTGKTEKIGR